MTNLTPLPYNFDTSKHGRVLAKLLLASAMVLPVAVGVGLYSLHDDTITMILPFILPALFASEVGAALFLFRAAGGASGTVGRVHVTIEPDRMFGLKTRSHQGTFPITEFAGFALSRIGAQGRLGVLRIIGKDPKLQVTLGVAPYDTIKAEAQSLAEQLSMPFKEV